MLILSASLAAPTIPPIGTLIVSPGRICCHVRTPATIAVGFCGLAPMSESKETPYFRAMTVGESPNWTEYFMIASFGPCYRE